MAKYISLDIPESCHENWEAMSPREQGRYCGSCSKTVIDFSLMSDSQIASYFQKNKGETCGRFYPDQLNKSIPVPKKQLPWLKYFFTITFPAIFFSQKSSAQNRPVKGEVKQMPIQNKNIPKTISVTGTVYDESGETVPGASVIVPGMRGRTATDADGKFSIELAALPAKIMITSIGFETKPVEVKTKNDLKIVLKSSAMHLQTVTVGAIGMTRLMGKVSGSVTSVTTYNTCQNIKPVVKEINIFPNPLPAESILNISWKEKIKDNQFIEIFSAEGNLIQTSIENPLNKDNTASVKLKKIPHGFYIVRATNMKTGEKLSKEFIVR